MKIHRPEGATLPSELELLPKLHKKLRHTMQSEGYETMTQTSIDTASEVKHISILPLLASPITCFALMAPLQGKQMHGLDPIEMLHFRHTFVYITLYGHNS